jgi:hypothetical protein
VSVKLSSPHAAAPSAAQLTVRSKPIRSLIIGTLPS